MLKIAIIGCGKIADQHVAAIRRVPDCRLVALCDREPLMAKQLGERFAVADCFADLGDMLRSTRPDVVHITTPPQSHASLARQCLEAGCHVYLEKPFTLTSEEAVDLVRLAEGRDLKLTAGHNLQFALEMLEMRQLVKGGYLGGNPVHVESYFSYNLGEADYAGALLGNRSHWVRQLPGQLFHNIISHGIAQLTEFLDDDLRSITALAHPSPKLASMGDKELLDELRVVIRDSRGTSAFFFFSTQVNPRLNELRVLGPANSLTVDHVNGCLIRNDNRPCKSYLTYFVPPLRAAKQHFKGGCSNLVNFLRRRLYQDFGMKELIERFYESIRNAGPPPIPYREILLTARIMDEIFAQIYPGREWVRSESAVTSHR